MCIYIYGIPWHNTWDSITMVLVICWMLTILQAVFCLYKDNINHNSGIQWMHGA